MFSLSSSGVILDNIWNTAIQYLQANVVLNRMEWKGVALEDKWEERWECQSEALWDVQLSHITVNSDNGCTHSSDRTPVHSTR